MKKLTILSVALVALSMASCKKDFTCSCTSTNTFPGSVTSTNEYTIVKAKKGDAKRACVKTTVTENGYTTTKDCQLK